MSVYSRSTERRRFLQEYRMREDEIAAALGRPESYAPKGQLEHEKKVRREIANSNERRRMQSINSGFQSLKTLIPHHEGEKLSKAAILQQTSDYIHNLEQEKDKILAQNAHLKRLLTELTQERDMEIYDSPTPKRKKRDTESSDEGISADFEEDAVRRELKELQYQLEKERRMRIMLEDQTRSLESQLYPERLRHIANQVHVQMHIQQEKSIYMDHDDVKKEHHIHMSQSPPQPPLNTSMSRRNLETIVEAIRHLEGDRISFEDRKLEISHRIPHSEESENSNTSDQDDTKSEGSGRDSPVSLVRDRSTSQSFEKYPIATNLLHRPTMPPQFYYRPGVIVQNS